MSRACEREPWGCIPGDDGRDHAPIIGVRAPYVWTCVCGARGRGDFSNRVRAFNAWSRHALDKPYEKDSSA